MELATNGIHVRQNEDLLEKDFNEISKVSNPKIISFNEAKNGITDHKTRYPKIFGDVEVDILDAYGGAWLYMCPKVQEICWNSRMILHGKNQII